LQKVEVESQGGPHYE